MSIYENMIAYVFISYSTCLKFAALMFKIVYDHFINSKREKKINMFKSYNAIGRFAAHVNKKRVVCFFVVC